MKKSQHSEHIVAYIVLGVLLIIASVGYYFSDFNAMYLGSGKGIACTMEAKQCPDGSYVGRQGPQCSFAPCPVATIVPMSQWKTYTNTRYNFSFKYPSDFSIEDNIDVQHIRGPVFSIGVVPTREAQKNIGLPFFMEIFNGTNNYYTTGQTDPDNCKSGCIYGREKIKFLGYDGYKISTAGEGGGGIFVSIIKDGMTYVMWYSQAQNVGNTLSQSILAQKIGLSVFESFIFTK